MTSKKVCDIRFEVEGSENANTDIIAVYIYDTHSVARFEITRDASVDLAEKLLKVAIHDSISIKRWAQLFEEHRDRASKYLEEHNGH